MKIESFKDTYIEFEMNFLSSTNFEFENREKFFPLAMYKIETKKFWDRILSQIYKISLTETVSDPLNQLKFGSEIGCVQKQFQTPGY